MQEVMILEKLDGLIGEFRKVLILSLKKIPMKLAFTI